MSDRYLAVIKNGLWKIFQCRRNFISIAMSITFQNLSSGHFIWSLPSPFSLGNHLIHFDKHQPPTQLSSGLPSCTLKRGCSSVTFTLVGDDQAAILKQIQEYLDRSLEVLILVGVAEGIETELAQDVSNTLYHYGSPPPQQNQDTYYSSDKKIRIRLIQGCTVKVFKEKLAELISNTLAPEVHIFYNGHGGPQGSIYFEDGEFYGDELGEILEIFTFFPKTHIVLLSWQ